MVDKRRFEKLSVDSSVLGFGCMRFPCGTDGKIDRSRSFKMIDTAYNAGINYFDTAYGYHDGESEPFAGEALSKYPRESFLLATKMPPWACHTKEDVQNIFENQKKRLKTDYFDFYMLHAMNAESWKKMLGFGALEFLSEQKKNGSIRAIGFSFHDDYSVFETIINHFDWDFVQIQLNYVDTDHQAGKRGFDLATEKGIPVIIMEPVKGGNLATLSNDITANFNKIAPDKSAASWAMRYVGSMPNVKVILSGMSNEEQLTDNIKTFTGFEPLTDKEYAAIDQAVSLIKKRVFNNCTGCKYCMPCPVGVNIASNFAMLNNYGKFNNKPSMLWHYENMLSEDAARASSCINCRECVSKCPQGIDIPADLKKLSDLIDKLI